MSDTTDSSLNTVTLSTKPNSSAIKWMVPLMVVLLLVAVVVWAFRPQEPVVEASPPRPIKTVAEVQKQMDIVKSNTHIPEGEKKRILGFMSVEMSQAKARARGETPPAMGPNPPGPQ